MALITVRLEADGLVVDAPGMPSLDVPLRPPAGEPRLARVWDDLVQSLTVSDDADRWFSEFLGISCKLVYLPDESVRPVDQSYGRPGDRVGDRKSTRLNSSHANISYAVFCLKKKTKTTITTILIPLFLTGAIQHQLHLLSYSSITLTQSGTTTSNILTSIYNITLSLTCFLAV